jgi:hypothetical protein
MPADEYTVSDKVVAQISKSAVSRVSRPAAVNHFLRLPIWKSAIQQTLKSNAARI